MSSQSSRYSSEPYNCNRCLKSTVVILSKTKKNPGRKFYTCAECNQWMGWCGNTANLSNVSLNYDMQPSRQVAIYRNEAEISWILKKQLAVLIAICVLILIVICFLLFCCFM